MWPTLTTPATRLAARIRDSYTADKTLTRWADLVDAYSEPSSTRYRVPDRINRPYRADEVATRAHLKASRRNAFLRTAGGMVVGWGAVFAAATTAIDPIGVAGVVAVVASLAVDGRRAWKLDTRLAELANGRERIRTFELSGFDRWLLGRAYAAYERASGVDGGPADTEERFGNALYQFACDVTDLASARATAEATGACDYWGRARGRFLHRISPEMEELLTHQERVLATLDLFDTTAREVVLAARAERAGVRGAERSLLDLQAEAITRREVLAELDSLQGLRELEA